SALDMLPEAGCFRVHQSEFALEALDLGVGIGVAVVEATPSAKPAAKAKSEIEDLPECAPGLVLRCDLALERLRGHHAVGFELRVTGLVVFPIGLELPRLVGQPSQVTTFDGAEISAYEGAPGGCADDRTGDITGDRQRSPELAHFGHIIGEDGGDRGVE